MSRIEAVVFDIGRVLIEWHPEDFFDEIMGSTEAREQMFYETAIMDMNDRIDMGEPWREAVYTLADQFPQYAEYIRLWHDRWLDIATPAIDGSVRLKAQLLAKNIPVFALTNFGVGTFEVAQRAYPFLREFDQTFVSGHLKMMKPDPAFYAVLENETGVDPEALLFTDDRPENLESARLRGWKTHLFTNPEGLAERLVAEGLLTPQEAEQT
jgi:2-haloacid dehalogenase